MSNVKVAFICVHNSCRSQIAEAFGRHLASDVFQSYSAGTETKPQINQDAVRIMKESYNIDMEVKYLDENPGKKLTQANYTKIGENVYYSEYTSQILNKLDSTSGKITLKEGDRIYVEVSNENSTAAQTIKSSFLSFSNEGEKVIKADSSGMVTVNGVN